MSTGKLKVEFIDNADSQYEANAALIKYGGKGSGGKLYLGDSFSASYVQLKARDCRTVVNCSREMHGFSKETNVNYLKIDPDDDGNTVLEESVSFILKALVQKKNVVVHCENGISKSAMIILHFLMVNSSKSLGEAYKLVRSVRGELKIPPRMLHTLMKIEKQRKGFNTISLDGRNVTVLDNSMLNEGNSRIKKEPQAKSSGSGLLLGLIVAGFFGVVYAVLVALTGKA
mmetsp:Transcript_21326/g.35696  ORF Transcript_21326/g.35696 Transcript_21326/m.35696 type:complete len:229 (-) Transcript_21326:42-728(-)